VETEVANFQRHISDIASLKASEASSKLEKTIARLTIFLVVLTAVLVAISLSGYKLPSDLELLPWKFIGLASLVYVAAYGVQRIRRRRTTDSSHLSENRKLS
jgi:membrane protein implicated in regulation of membrane protease activity